MLISFVADLLVLLHTHRFINFSSHSLVH